MIITVDIDGVPLCDLGNLGSEVTRIHNNEADLRLPDGWKTREEGSRVYIQNSNGEDRASVQRSLNGIPSHLTLYPRYSAGVYGEADCNTYTLSVFDKGFRIADLFSIPATQYRQEFHHSKFGRTRRENEAIAKYFADKPNWRNPLAYWSEQ